jgi:ribosomal protein S18 acetylase RimI-like enzyme
VTVNTTILAGQQTLLACWEALAQISWGARLVSESSAAVAVFPTWAPLNNAIVLNSCDPPMTIARQVASIYAAAGVSHWALWLPSPVADLDAGDDVVEVDDLPGLRRDTTTLVMQATLSPGLRLNDAVVRTSVATATRAGDEPVHVGDLEEPDQVPGLSAWVMVEGNYAIAGAWSFLRERDCGIYAVGTVPGWRRRGIARALTEHALSDAVRRGARTATLQSTRMGRRLYEGIGFEPVGRYEEWVPSVVRSDR